MSVFIANTAMSPGIALRINSLLVSFAAGVCTRGAWGVKTASVTYYMTCHPRRLSYTVSNGLISCMPSSSKSFTLRVTIGMAWTVAMAAM